MRHPDTSIAEDFINCLPNFQVMVKHKIIKETKFVIKCISEENEGRFVSITPGGKGNKDINERLRGELSQNGRYSCVNFFPSGSGYKLKPNKIRSLNGFCLVVSCHIGLTEILRIKSKRFQIFSDKKSRRYQDFIRG